MNTLRTSTSPSPGSGIGVSASSKSLSFGNPCGRAARRISRLVPVAIRGPDSIPLSRVAGILSAVAGENSDLLRDWFEATARQDVARLLELASPDIEYVPIMAVLEGRV